jgi:hypothetical protein
MQDPGNWNTDQIKQFLEGGQEIYFQSQNQAEQYEWIGKTLVAQQYASRNRAREGVGAGNVR